MSSPPARAVATASAQPSPQPSQSAVAAIVPPPLRRPYLLFIGDVRDALTAKTAFGLADWCPDRVVGQWRLTGDAVDIGLRDLEPEAAAKAGCGSLVIGAAPAGGQIPDGWAEALRRAAAAGLDIVSGLHSPLGAVPGLAAAAARSGAALREVRRPPEGIPVGTGQRRPGRRLLTVGADCAIGKKYTALAIHREMLARGWNADFRATGQTGILIAGAGIPIDAVVSDFLAGAAELLSPAAEESHWDVIEGQGSLFHPSYAGVSLGLLHGSQPDALVLCYDTRRREIDGCPGFAVPAIATAIARNEEAARLTNPAARCVGVSLNTKGMDAAEADAVARAIADAFGLPCVDPIRHGSAPIVDRLAGP